VKKYRIDNYGDSTINVQFSEDFTDRSWHLTHSLAKIIKKECFKWVLNIIPTYTSILILYDIDKVERKYVINEIEKKIEINFESTISMSNNHFYIPVLYGGDEGPDLNRVARILNLSEKEVIRLHTASPSQVLCFSANGQALMGKSCLPQNIHRLDTPHTANKKGSVAVVGNQSTIYPEVQPGGWNVIGRTPLPVTNINLDPITPFKVGDWVHYFEINLKEWELYRMNESNFTLWGEDNE